MPPWLTIWIIRFVSGERFRKATPRDNRFWSGFFFLFPIYFFVMMAFERPFLHNASAVTIWLVLTPVCVALVFGSFLWARLVPARISWTLAAVAWPVLLWYLWHHEFAT
jgi:hypothetical protein